MNANELIRMGQRKLILKMVKDNFNGVVEKETEIIVALRGYRSNKSVRNDLDWLVEHGYLLLERKDNWTKTYTLTEKAT